MADSWEDQAEEIEKEEDKKGSSFSFNPNASSFSFNPGASSFAPVSPAPAESAPASKPAKPANSEQTGAKYARTGLRRATSRTTARCS